jgi:hypothetical protein
MWKTILSMLPSKLTIICAILSVLIPWGIYFINQKLHQYGDPPWKKDQNDTNQP